MEDDDENTLAKDTDEVNFSYESNFKRLRGNRVRLRSNSIPSGYGSSGEKTSEDGIKYNNSKHNLQMDESTLDRFRLDDIIDSDQNNTKIIENQDNDYVIVDKKEVQELEKKHIQMAQLRNNTISPCNKLDGDEVTVVDFTTSECFDSDGSLQKVSKKQKLVKKQVAPKQEWQSKIVTNYGIKQIAVDLSNSYNDMKTR